MKNLVQRTISGIVYLGILIGSLFAGKYTYGTVMLIIAIIALAEYADLMGLRHVHVKYGGFLWGAGIFIVSFLVASRLISIEYLLLTGLLLTFSFILILHITTGNFIHELAAIFLGILYIVIPLALMNYLAFPVINGYGYTRRIILGMLILVWINDTGAYVTGSIFGRHKLFPRISPKKSWEGLAGGTLFTMVAAIWMDRFMGMLSATNWLIIAAIVSVFGVYGDLTESLLKRNANKKDSGNLIPGHGGVLDRFDSVLFVIPIVTVYLALTW